MKFFSNKLLLASLAISFIFSTSYGQRENDTWVFGNNKWIFDSNQSNGFNSSLIGGNYHFLYGTASISDYSTGNLLFFSNGISIFDKNGNLMQNGGDLFGQALPNSALERFYLTSGL